MLLKLIHDICARYDCTSQKKNRDVYYFQLTVFDPNKCLAAEPIRLDGLLYQIVNWGYRYVSITVESTSHNVENAMLSRDPTDIIILTICILSASEITLIIIIATSAFGMLFCGLLIYLVVKMTENAKEIEMLQSQLRETNEAARRDPAAFESSRQNRTTETRERDGESFTVVTGVHPNINL